MIINPQAARDVQLVLAYPVDQIQGPSIHNDCDWSHRKPSTPADPTLLNSHARALHWRCIGFENTASRLHGVAVTQRRGYTAPHRGDDFGAAR